MSLEETPVTFTDREDFGMAGHLASIERMHRDALAQLEALAQPWGNLWSPPLAGTASRSEEQHTSAGQRHGAHAAAA